MLIVPDKSIRRYVAFENGKWIHDPNMPECLMDKFSKFVMQVQGEVRIKEENKNV